MIRRSVTSAPPKHTHTQRNPTLALARLSGGVAVYKRGASGLDWNFQAEFKYTTNAAVDGEADRVYGCAMTENRFVISSERYTNGAGVSQAGGAWVYVRDPTTDVWAFEQQLVHPVDPATASDKFGKVRRRV